MSGSHRLDMLSEEMEVLPITTTFFRRVSRVNTRIPPIARKAAVPCKVANVSHSKLQQAAASPSPDLRRCVGHNAVFRQSMEAAQAERRRQMNHLSYYEDDGLDYGANDRTEIDISAIREQVAKSVKAMIRRRFISSTQEVQSEKSNALVRVSARASHENDTLQQATEKKNKFAAKSRKYASRLVPGRRMFMHPHPSPMLHANTVF
ncbi:hypothetical protein CNMCM5793_001258 [Aspergillus hiratsukae]|uniref:Uncharacterized protein n=1 Tax=Aspergillus hiratsukae TaxID=1194566 RepID=A0A8H6PB62_9EURO|nr:hypothetical protein CNMCM5793_001258 [Aspergillus hiratsukae]